MVGLTQIDSPAGVTRAALSTGERAKSNFLSILELGGEFIELEFVFGVLLGSRLCHLLPDLLHGLAEHLLLLGGLARGPLALAAYFFLLAHLFANALLFLMLLTAQFLDYGCPFELRQAGIEVGREDAGVPESQAVQVDEAEGILNLLPATIP